MLWVIASLGDGRRRRRADVARLSLSGSAPGWSAFSVTELPPQAAALCHRVVAVHGRAPHLRPPAEHRGRPALPRAEICRRSGSRPRSSGKPIPTVWLQSHLWHGAQRPPLVGLRGLVHLPDALLRHADRRRRAVDVGARPLRPLRDDGVRPRARRVRDLRPLPGRAAVARRAAGLDRRGEPNDRRSSGITSRSPTSARSSSTGQTYANNVAAMPSLHAAYSLLLVLFLWRLVPRWTRPLLALYPPAMAFALVYAGEHFVVDCLAGWVYAAATFVVVERAFAWRADVTRSSSRSSPIERGHAASALRGDRRRRAVAGLLVRDRGRGGNRARRHGDDRLDPRARRGVGAGAAPLARARRRSRDQHAPPLRPLRRQPPLRRDADVCPAERAGRGAGARLPRGLGALRRQLLRAARRRCRAVRRHLRSVDTRPFARPPVGGRRERRTVSSCSAAT